ncbi:unnamed protein product [Ectocarpus sp. 12 AP-2014]
MLTLKHRVSPGMLTPTHPYTPQHGICPQKKIAQPLEASVGTHRKKAGRIDMETAVKWVTATDGRLQATEEARERLSNVSDEQSLSVVTILGAARQGKSFLMNALTRSNNGFRVSPEVYPCTAGADLFPILMPLSEFKRGSAGNIAHLPSSSPQPTIGFVDMEGQGDRSDERDVRLATPFLLVSKVVLFNWLGLPNKSTILQRLVVMIKAAEKVSRRKNKGEPTFGHLILVMRDVKQRAAEIESLIMDDEDGGLTHEDAQGVPERNLIRKRLRAVFKSMVVHTMHRPHPEIADGAVPLSEVSPGFTTSLDELRDTIAEHLTTPHTFAGQPIAGGERLHDIVGGLCEAVNSTGDICPPSVLEAIDMRCAQEEKERALVLFDAMLSSVRDGVLVFSTREVTRTINDAREKAFEQFHQATQAISSRITKGVQEELVEQMSPKAAVVAGSQEAKRRELSTKMQARVSSAEADVSGAALGWNAINGYGKSTGMDEGELDMQWNQLVGSTFQALQKDLKKMTLVNRVVNEALLHELGWNLSRKQFEGLIKGTRTQVQERNRVALAHEEERKAKEAAEKRAKELEEENASLQEQTAEANQQRDDARGRQPQRQEQDDPNTAYENLRRLVLLQQLMGGGGMFFYPRRPW